MSEARIVQLIGAGPTRVTEAQEFCIGETARGDVMWRYVFAESDIHKFEVFRLKYGTEKGALCIAHNDIPTARYGWVQVLEE